MEMFGHESACAFQSFYLIFFVFWEACILGLISYSAERIVCAGLYFTNRKVFIYTFQSAVYSAILSTACIFLPYGGYQLNSSGTLCFIDFRTPVASVSLFLGIIIPTAVMIYRYNKIWQNVTAAQMVLTRRGIKSKAKAKFHDRAKKMSFFIVTFFGCAIPILISAFYEWSTAQLSPDILSIIVGICLHITPLINPIVFILTNKLEFLYIQKLFYKTEFYRKVRKSIMSVTRNEPLKDTRAEPEILVVEVGEWKVWCDNADLLPSLERWSETHYVAESFLFYRDVVKFRDVAQHATNSILDVQSQTTHSKAAMLCGTAEAQDQLHDLASLIYELYIQYPDAPMEVNISATCREKIRHILNAANCTRNANGHLVIPPFRDVFGLSHEDASHAVNEIVQVFDEAFHEICKVIETDIFPRFKSDAAYIKALKDMADRHREKKQSRFGNWLSNHMNASVAAASEILPGRLRTYSGKALSVKSLDEEEGEGKTAPSPGGVSRVSSGGDLRHFSATRKSSGGEAYVATYTATRKSSIRVHTTENGTSTSTTTTTSTTTVKSQPPSYPTSTINVPEAFVSHDIHIDSKQLSSAVTTPASRFAQYPPTSVLSPDKGTRVTVSKKAATQRSEGLYLATAADLVDEDL